MEKTYPLLEAIFKNSKYAVDNTLTIADFSIISSVSSIETVLPIDKTKYPNLLAWKLRVEAIPYYYEANQVGTAVLSEIIRNQLDENRKKAGKI